MKKSKVLGAALAVTMFATAACGLVACDKEAGGLPEDLLPDTGKSYTITFDANGGTLKNINGTTLTTDKSGNLSGTMPTAEKANNTFKGWALTKTATTAAITNATTFTAYTFTDNTTVYAVFAEQSNPNPPEEYTITFDYGDGSGTPESMTTTDGKLTSLPTATPPENYKFEGWYTAQNGGGEKKTAPATFTANTPLYAYYTEEQQIIVSSNYCMVGSQKYDLTEKTIAGAEQGYTATVDLDEGETISFYINGEIIEAWPGYIWNGMAKSQKASSFTAARQGTFTFDLGYYPANEETQDDATWSVDGDDGQSPMLPDNQITLQFNDATITLAFDLPNYATSDASVYVFNGSGTIGTSGWPGSDMDGSTITIGANIADCKVIISFEEGNDRKQSGNEKADQFSDGSTYIITVGSWSNGQFAFNVTEA